MNQSVVILGAGYAGSAAITRFEELDGADHTWVSRQPYHFVLHEGHRVIGDPAAAEALTIPVSEIAGTGTEFVHGTVTGLDTDERTVLLADGTSLSYDYLIVAVGSATEFYGIPGVREHAHTLKSRSDALSIASRVSELCDQAARNTPARVVIGGAGLSGVQIAGEIAEQCDHRCAPVDIRLIESLDRPLPNEDPDLGRSVRRHLAAHDIDLVTGHPITAADGETVAAEGLGTVPYDLFIWTGGITGRTAVADVGQSAPNGHLRAESSGSSGRRRVFLAGDAAAVGGGERAPPNAQAAWQAGTTAAENVIRSIRDRPVEPFRYRDRGTLLSIGNTAIAHGVPGVPWRTFNGLPAKIIKKGAAARWIASITSVPRAARAWRYL